MTLVAVAETLFPGESRVGGGIPCLAEEQRNIVRSSGNQPTVSHNPIDTFNNGPFCYQKTMNHFLYSEYCNK